MEAKNSVAANIKNLAKKSGLKFYVIAERMGVDRRVFSDMINGRRVIRATDIVKFARALNVTPNDIFGFTA